jgi:predicted metalloendopeptidase
MVENIKNQFKFILNETNWLDDTSKRKATIKANLIEDLIGYPNLTYNDCYLDNVLYKEFRLEENRFLNNLMIGLSERYKLLISELRKEYDRKRYL